MTNRLTRSLPIASLLLSGMAAAQPQAPTSLLCPSATKSAVQLTWASSDSSAAGFRVERRQLGDAAYAAIGSPTAKAFTDAAIDSMATYVYRVRALDAAGNASGPSNEITIGPPPLGVSLMSPYRPSLNFYDESQFGVRPQMTLDANGDPAVVYSVISPNNIDGKDTSADSFLEFVGWDRTRYSWKSPVKIGLLGNGTPTGGGVFNYSMARDAVTGAWAVATLVIPPDDSYTELRIYTSSDNGAAWNPISAFIDNTYGLDTPSIALNAGIVHVAFFQDYNGIRYVTGKLSDDPAKWTSTIAPLPVGADDYRREHQLALDNKGNPGIAYYGYGGSYNSILAFWRPGDDSASYILDSNGYQNDFVEVKLAFFGTDARVAALVVRDDQGPSGYDRYYWVSAQRDGVFGPPAGLPSDGNSALAYGSFAIGSQGQAALVSERVGGNSDNVQCGNPKVSRSTDLINWTTCSPYPMSDETYRHSDWPQTAFSPNDGLYIAMNNGDDQNPSLWGIILWRER